jgi:AAA+ ATPase superfamily predicted ATPase
MAIFKPEDLPLQEQKFSMIIYGAPGVGKTTLASSAPNPILFDLDKGIQRIRAQHRPLVSRVNTYEELLADIQSADVSKMDTIVIDTGGALITLLQDYAMRKDPVNKTKSGSISQKGFGAVKQEFVNLTNTLKTKFNKNIIYVFHALEEKNKEGNPIQRLMCEGSAKNIVWQPCDFGAFLYKSGDKTFAGFTPTDEYFAKGCYGVTGVRPVPFGDGVKNDFLKTLFEEANANIQADNEFFAAEKDAYEKAMAEGKELIQSIDSPETATVAAEKVGKELKHSLTSKEELRQILREKIVELGFVWDKEKKSYIAPAKTKAETEKQESRPVSKPDEGIDNE